MLLIQIKLNRISPILRKKRCNKNDEIQPQEPKETLEVQEFQETQETQGSKEPEKIQKRPIRKKKQDLINSKMKYLKFFKNFYIFLNFYL